MIYKNIIEHLLGDVVQIKVLKVLRLNQKGITGRGLGKLVGTSSFKIQQVLKKLVALNVVTENIIGRAHLYTLNLKHILVKTLIKDIFDYENNILTHLGSEIAKNLKPAPLSIILYGSVAQGEEKPESDLDLLVVYKKNNEPQPDFGPLISNLTQSYGNPAAIQFIFLTELQHSKDKNKTLLRRILKEGRVIFGLSLTELLNSNGTRN